MELQNQNPDNQEDLRTDTEREADEQAALARAELAEQAKDAESVEHDPTPREPNGEPMPMIKPEQIVDPTVQTDSPPTTDPNTEHVNESDNS